MTATKDLEQIKARDVLVRARTKLVNHAKAVVKSFGKRLPKTTADAFARKTADSIPVELTAALDPIYRSIAMLDDRIKDLDQKIEQTAKRYPDVETISQPDGVGTLTALTFVLTIEDKERFKSSRMVGAFLGLRPRRDQSGSSDKQLHITKAEDPYLRRLLVVCANRILGPFGKDCDLRRWGVKLAKTGGKNARKRAKVAVARKLAVLLHRLWVTSESYEPLRQPAAAA